MLLLAFAFSLLLAEVCLRVFLPANKSIYALDERLLFRLSPNSSKVFVHDKRDGGGQVAVKINSSGFRDREILPQKTTDIRILVYGDSFIEAEFSDEANTFVKVLERVTAALSQKSVEAINAGVISYGPDQISLRIENDLDRLHPDLVVVAVFSGNDFGDLIRNKIYELDEAGNLVWRNYHLSESLRAEFAPQGRLRTLSVSKKVLDRLRGRNSPIPPWLDDPAKYIETSLTRCRQDYEDYLNNTEVSNLFKDQYDSDVALTPETESARYKVRLMGQVLKRIKRSADDKATSLVFLFIPSVTDVCSSYEIKVDPAGFASYRPSALTDALENAIKDDKTAHLNLFESFRSGNPCSLYFNFPNGHWNDTGQRLAAERLGEFLVSSRVLK